MRTSLLVLLTAGVLAVALAGCASGPPEAAPTTSPSATPTPAPTPTVEPIVIGPAEMPPVVFGGDCENALPVADLAEILGDDATVTSGTDNYANPPLTNVGGIECSYVRPSSMEFVELVVIPRAGVDGATLPAIDSHYFEDCNGGGYCSWQGGDDALWLAVTIGNTGMTQQQADEANEELARRVLANFAAADEQSWTRDRTGWWPVLDCGAVAAAVGSQLGDELAGVDAGFPDTPVPGRAMAAAAAGRVTCLLGFEPDKARGVVAIDPGLGGELTMTGLETADLGTPGITAVRSPDGREGAFYLSDGVNRVHVYLDTYGESTIDPADFAIAVAAAAASDFQ